MDIHRVSGIYVSGTYNIKETSYTEIDHSVYFDVIYSLCVCARSLGKNERKTGNNDSDAFIALERVQICVYTKKQ